MSKTIAIMQPYFLPYIGYWQLMNAVDEFVVYDNIQFTKKGWINRNRYLMNGRAEIFSLPIKKASDYLNVVERSLSENYDEHAKKLLRKFEASYKAAPYFVEGMELLRNCLLCEERNLFKFIYHSINEVKKYLKIDTNLVISSDLSIDHSLKSAEKVKAICATLGAHSYVNPYGGESLYDKDNFQVSDISLRFIKAKDIHYKQLGDAFIPWLSIIDLIMNCSNDELSMLMNDFDYL